MGKLSLVYVFAFLILQQQSLLAQNGADEPCKPTNITVNSLLNPKAQLVTATINNKPSSTFTNSVSGSVGIQFTQPDCNGFNTLTRDWWYAFTVPYSGYVEIDFTDLQSKQYFDWTMYTATDTSKCEGNVLTEIAGSSQCTKNGGQPTLTQVGPLAYGTKVYLRMWHEAAFNQSNILSYSFYVNEIAAPDDVPACVVPLFPENKAVIYQNSVLLQWQTSMYGNNYDVYVKDSTANEDYQLISNTSSNNYLLTNLIGNHVYCWYIVPNNQYAETNNSCSTPQLFTVRASVTATAATALPMCVPGTIATGIYRSDSAAGLGADYGCLTEHANPSFYWFKAAKAGIIKLRLTTNPANDIDYVVWGPFYGLKTGFPSSANPFDFSGFPKGAALGTPVSCDNSATNGGDIEIDNPLDSAYYLLMISNAANIATQVSVKTFGSNQAVYDCEPNIYDVLITPNNDCNNNAYSIKYSFKTKLPPTSGSLVITDNNGHSISYNAPFAASYSGTLSGLVTQGKSQPISIYFTDFPSIQSTTLITPPSIAPPNNTCSAITSYSTNGFFANISGYTNQCAGKETGEPNYGGTAACKSVFYKIKTNGSVTGNALYIQLKGGNLSTTDCAKGIRVALFNSCNTLASVTPSSNTITDNNGLIFFSGLQPSTEYYIAISPGDCASYNCSWNMHLQGVGVLPVFIDHFQAKAIDNKCHLQWTSQNEFAIKHFVVERSSDGQNFNPIATVTATVQTVANSYQFTDELPAVGINYYRIKIVTEQGVYYSIVQKIALDNHQFTIKGVYPNPIAAQTYLSVTNLALQQVHVQLHITDASGRVQNNSSLQVMLKQGDNRIKLPTQGLPKGVYYLRIQSAFNQFTTKLICL